MWHGHIRHSIEAEFILAQCCEYSPVIEFCFAPGLAWMAMAKLPSFLSVTGPACVSEDVSPTFFKKKWKLRMSVQLHFAPLSLKINYVSPNLTRSVTACQCLTLTPPTHTHPTPSSPPHTRICYHMETFPVETLHTAFSYTVSWFFS